MHVEWLNAYFIHSSSFGFGFVVATSSSSVVVILCVFFLESDDWGRNDGDSTVFEKKTFS